jgi:hypothetical protein
VSRSGTDATQQSTAADVFPVVHLDREAKKDAPKEEVMALRRVRLC